MREAGARRREGGRGKKAKMRKRKEERDKKYF